MRVFVMRVFVVSVLVVSVVVGGVAMLIGSVDLGSRSHARGPREGGQQVNRPASPEPGGSGPVVVAQHFAAAIWSFDWRDPSGVTSVRPWVTPTLWARLRATPGAPVFDAARRAAHEVDVVGPVSAVVEDAAVPAVGIALSAPVTVRTAYAPAVIGRRDMEILVLRGLTGWQTAAVDQ